MRIIGLALAATAALTIAAPAAAGNVPYNYVVTGTNVSGSFELNFDNVADTYSLLGINLTIGGAAYTTMNAGLSGTVSPLVLGANSGGITTLNVGGSDDDFLMTFDPDLVLQSTLLDYHLGSVGGSFFQPDVTLARSEVSAVPEPATWALMLLGFAGMGFAFSRRKLAAA